ncbi:hypothetical protein [Peribacillus sp. TH14]|uniref:hypothetical protein n=1 Tax=Peribacillus sp. TH14 TaxID=2798481 RepID=UPI001A939F5C|nr:hypothetical protein [Peribacillus sp. TH14]
MNSKEKDISDLLSFITIIIALNLFYYPIFKENVLTIILFLIIICVIFRLLADCFRYILKMIIKHGQRGEINNKHIRFKNGMTRFYKRIKDLWYINLLFLVIVLLSLIFERYFSWFEFQAFIVNVLSLIVTVYVLDFLYSEESRKSSANKRYLTDHAFGDLINLLESALAEMLIDEKFVEFNCKIVQLNEYNFLSEEDKNHFPQATEVFYPWKIYEYTPEDIQLKIEQSGFWTTSIKINNFFYSDKETLPRLEFLKIVINKTKKEINSHLTRYSHFMMYGDFKIIFELDRGLQDYYLREGINFETTNQEMLSHTLHDLIINLDEARRVFYKWK